MKFINKTPKHDRVTTYVSEDGLIRITKRPGESKWVVRQITLFNILGEIIGEFDSLEDAINSAAYYDD